MFEKLNLMLGFLKTYSKPLKIVAVLLASAAIFFFGYQFASAIYSKEIAEIIEDYATRSQALEAQYRAKEQDYAQNLIKAREERDKALGNLVDLRNDADRVRNEANELRRQLSASEPNTGDIKDKQLARSAELLARGAELVERCSSLSQRIAIDKDEIVRIVE